MSTLASQADLALRQLEGAGLMRRPCTVSGAQGPELSIDARRVVCLCSNNYLGLANHPSISAAAAHALLTAGVGAAASRHVCGTMDFHKKAEERLSRFLGAQAALLFSTGYAANLGVLQALAGPQDIVLSDALNHASIIDGCRLSRAKVLVFDHADPDHLASLLHTHRSSAERAVIVTEALFSMDGDIAPLSHLAELRSRYEAALVVDEAHSLGVMGPRGTGLCASHGVQPDVLVGTLGKAFGAAGAFAAGPNSIVQLIENRARSYIFSTAPPPSIAAAAAAATDLVEAADEGRARLTSHAARLRSALSGAGFRVPAGESAIIPILVGEPRSVMRFSADLMERGVFVHGFRPPSVPAETSRLRITPMATHDPFHVEHCIQAFQSLAPRYARSTSSPTHALAVCLPK